MFIPYQLSQKHVSFEKKIVEYSSVKSSIVSLALNLPEIVPIEVRKVLFLYNSNLPYLLFLKVLSLNHIIKYFLFYVIFTDIRFSLTVIGTSVFVE